jgi:signal peptidase I
MARSPWRTGLWTALLVVAMGAFWLTFAPTVAGGRSAYVIVAGASMEPTLRRGDLVIARAAESYQAGDIVTYQHPTVGPVIHRILEADNGTYTLQGDANDWTDSYHPAPGEILGKAWIHLPRVGSLLTWLRLPPVMGLLALVISFLVVSMVWPSRDSAPAKGPPGRVDTWLSGWAESASSLQFIVFLLGLMALLGFLLALPAWSRPLSRAADRVYPYAHSGAFQYSGRVPSEVFGDSVLRTGQPTYLKLTRRLSLAFDYSFTSDSPSSITGTTSLAVEVSDINGWTRRLVLQEPQPFEGATARASGILNLGVISGYLEALEERTGVTRPYYTVSVQPVVQVEGVVAGLPLTTTFEPELKFMIDDLQLQLAPQDPALGEGDPLAPRKDAAVETTVPAPNRLTILGVSPTVRAARWISGVLLLLGVGGLGLLTWIYLRSVRRDPLVAIQLKYGAQLVAMRPQAFEIGGATVDVASLDDLARVAEKHGRLIHWVAKEAAYDFFVPTGETLYAFRLAVPEAPVPTVEAIAPTSEQAGKPVSTDDHREPGA